MKKFLVAVLSWMISFQLSAQLPTGSIAPDFTMTDLQGQQHNLYNVLNSNKVVVLQFMSTNSQICWGYHQTQTMKKLYDSYGPGVNNSAVDIEIFFIEADPETDPVCLTQGCSMTQFQSWANGISYPMSNNVEIGNLYQIDAFPRFYVICPDKIVTLIGTYNNNEILALANKCPMKKGGVNGGLFDFKTGIPFQELCGSQTASSTVRLVNEGDVPLTQADLYLSWEGQTFETIHWTGNLNTYESDTISFQPININGSGSLKILATIPGDVYDLDNFVQQSFSTPPNVEMTDLLLRIRTDAFGAETYWELRDFDSTLIEVGGNLLIGPDGGGQFPAGITSGPGAYHDESIVRDTLHLPGFGCYYFKIVDGFGDGICCGGTVQGFYKIYGGPSVNTYPVLISGGEFKTYELHVIEYYQPVGSTEKIAADPKLTIQPNPVGAQLSIVINLRESTLAALHITDAYGRTVWTQPARKFDADRYEIQLNSADWAPGLYCLNWNDDQGATFTKKFVVIK